MPDIRIVPANAIMSFTSSLNFIERITQDPSGSLTLFGSGSTGRTDLFSIDGNNGRLFSVSDDLSDSLFSVNTIAGLPVIEAFADNRVNIGQYGVEAIKVSGSRATITGSLQGTASYATQSATASWATNVTNNGVTSVSASGTVSGITLGGGPITSTGTLTLSGTVSGLTNSNLSGTAGITNANLANPSLMVGTTNIALGATGSTLAGLTSVAATTFTGALTGNASTATLVTGTSGQLQTKDDRIIEPNSITTARLQFGFTSWGNDNGSPYADYLHLRSYSDGSGGNDNLVMFRKDAIGMRIWQQAYGSATAYSSFKDVAWTDGTNASGNWTINVTGSLLGNASTATSASFAQTSSYSTNISGTTNYVSKFTGANSLGNSLIYDNGTNVGIGTTSPGSKLNIVGGFLRVNGTDTDNYFFEGVRTGTSTTLRIYDNASTVYYDSHATMAFRANQNGGSGGNIIFTGGNVGIGTSSPSVASGLGLVLNGQAGQTRLAFKNNYTGDTSTDGVQFALIGGTSAFVFQNRESDGYFSFETNGNEVFRTSGTNVGIGTTTPTSGVHVIRNASGPVSYPYLCAVFGDNTASGSAVYTNSLGVAGRVLQTGSRAIYGDASTGGGWAGYFDGKGYFSGSLGISIDSPQTKLHIEDVTKTLTNNVAGVAQGTLSLVATDAQAADVGASLVFGGNYINSSSTRIAYAGITGRKSNSSSVNADGYLSFLTWRSTGLTEAMRITAAGDVGIGVTSIQGKLHVAQNTNLGGTAGNNLILQTLQNTGGSGGNAVYIKDYAVRDATGTDWTTWRHHNSIDIDGVYDTPGTNTRTFWERDPFNGVHEFGQSTTYSVTIDVANSRLGISTRNPSYPLHVNANVSGTSIYASADIVAYSDESVKENIRPIENVIERIQQSRGVLYDRTDIESKDNIGFIAQELEIAFPELVITNEDGTKAVKYQNTVAVLFEAIKEQQKQIDELKQIVNGITG